LPTFTASMQPSVCQYIRISVIQAYTTTRIKPPMKALRVTPYFADNNLRFYRRAPDIAIPAILSAKPSPHWGLEPLPCQSIVPRFYNDLQDRGDCQSTRKSYKTYFLWVGLWVGNPRMDVGLFVARCASY
jgi:hypothetical protein